MPTFIALYRGLTISDARLVAVSADPQLVADVASSLLRDRQTPAEPDPALRHIDNGRRRALKAVAHEAIDAQG